MKSGNIAPYMRIRAGILLSALIVAVFVSCGGKYLTYEQQLLVDADSLFDAGNYEYAKDKFVKIKTLKPTSPAARTAQYYLGYINIYYENPFASWEAALREFKLFVSLYPDDARIDEVNSWIKLLTVMQSFKRDYLGTTDRLEELRLRKMEQLAVPAQKQATPAVDPLSESLRNCYHVRDSLNQKSKDLENFIIDLEKECQKVGNE